MRFFLRTLIPFELLQIIISVWTFCTHPNRKLNVQRIISFSNIIYLITCHDNKQTNRTILRRSHDRVIHAKANDRSWISIKVFSYLHSQLIFFSFPFNIDTCWFIYVVYILCIYISYDIFLCHDMFQWIATNEMILTHHHNHHCFIYKFLMR